MHHGREVRSREREERHGEGGRQSERLRRTKEGRIQGRKLEVPTEKGRAMGVWERKRRV